MSFSLQPCCTESAGLQRSRTHTQGLQQHQSLALQAGPLASWPQFGVRTFDFAVSLSAEKAGNSSGLYYSYNAINIQSFDREFPALGVKIERELPDQLNSA